ncbi:MAG: 4-(cytidine 5'-diphospho)-2-C-methyl-D-erythritol kinase [Clostridia bacterium]|nr:4-(cytidine 5'-diphospho)-2-C-methyl-D-erythritol kinase [Clostridia bacterium]
MTFEATAPAKINLTLDILGKRVDGYHDVAMLMQSVSLADTVKLTLTDSEDISISCSDPSIPCDSRNIVYKVSEVFFKVTGIKNTGIEIYIEKVIPSEAGLAGGSADGAATLRLLNVAFDAHLTDKELCEIGAKVGADIPFCILGGTKLATGTGTTLNKVRSMPKCHIVIVKPEVSVSTKEAYSLADNRQGLKIKYTDYCKQMLYSGDLSGICSTLHNDFEEVLNLSDINDVKKIMYDCKALGAAMSGSGSAVFGIFRNERKAQKCAQKLKETYEKVYLAVPVSNGAGVI